MRYRLPIVVLVLVLASTVAKSQVRDFSASPTSPTPPAIGGPDERITVLEGKVVSEAGFAPGESVTVVLECESHASMRAHSDARGNFSLMLTEADGGHGRGILRTQAGTSAFPLADCELYGELSGYRSEHIRLPDSRDGGIVQVGVISLHPVSPEHGSSVSVTSLAAPEKAKKSLQKGQQQAKKGKWAAAADYFKRAVEVYPRYALAWVELGRTQVQQNSLAEAQQSFRQSVQQDSKFLDGYVGLAYLALQQKQWKALADTTERVVEFAPNSAEFWFLNSVASFNLGNTEQAETSIGRGLRLDQKHEIPEMEYLYGLILANRHDYGSAAERVSAYLRLAPGARNAEAAHKLLAEFQERAQDPAAPVAEKSVAQGR
jgi:tetratricopeptide (TPR) repeat protein